MYHTRMWKSKEVCEEALCLESQGNQYVCKKPSERIHQTVRNEGDDCLLAVEAARTVRYYLGRKHIQLTCDISENDVQINGLYAHDLTYHLIWVAETLSVKVMN